MGDDRLGGFGREVARQTAVAHVVPLHPAFDGLDLGTEPLLRRQPIAAKRQIHRLATIGEVKIDHLSAETSSDVK
jgi:hypothetical protein